MEGFMEYTNISTHGLIHTRLYQGLTWPNSGTGQQLLVVVSHAEFQQNLLNSLWDTWKSQFMVLCKLGFVMDKPTHTLPAPDRLGTAHTK
jgi:hypothetical protein